LVVWIKESGSTSYQEEARNEEHLVNDKGETPSATPTNSNRNLQADDTTSTNKRRSRTGFKRRREESLFLLGAFQRERFVRGLTASPA